MRRGLGWLVVVGCSATESPTLPAIAPYDASAPGPQPLADASADASEDSGDAGRTPRGLFEACGDASPCVEVVGSPGKEWSEHARVVCLDRHTSEGSDDLYQRCTFWCDRAGGQREHILRGLCEDNGGDCITPFVNGYPICRPKPKR